jgi:hypothetical protein
MTDTKIEVFRVEIAKLDVGPSDVLVISYPPAATEQDWSDRYDTADFLRGELGCRVLIGSTDTKLSVLHVSAAREMVEGDL